MSKKIVVGLIAVALLFGGSFGSVQAQGMDVGQLLDFLVALGIIPQDKAAAARTAAGTTVSNNSSSCYTFSRDLTVGSSGPDVEALNKILSNENISERIAGESSYFDENTAGHVVKFQQKYGIRATGYVGPLTRAKLNTFCASTQTNTNQGQASVKLKSVANNSHNSNSFDYIVTSNKTFDKVVFRADCLDSQIEVNAKGGMLCNEHNSVSFGPSTQYSYPVTWSSRDGVSRTVGMTVFVYLNDVLIGTDRDAITVRAQTQATALSASCSGYANVDSVKVTWTASTSGGSGSKTYSWSAYNDVSAYTGGSTQSASFTASYSSSGTKQAVVTVRDSSGNTASASCSSIIYAKDAAKPSIQITYPLAGYKLSNGGKDAIGYIKWTTQNFGDLRVNINLISSSGYSIKTIAENVSNTGSYYWQNDPSIPTGYYQILLGSADKGPSTQSYSGLFELVQPTASAPAVQTVSPVTGTASVAASPSTISSGGSVNLSFTWPSDTVKAQVYLSCPNGVTGNGCNAYTTVTSNRDYTFILSNTSGQPQSVVPNYYVYSSSNPNYANGVTTQFTIQAASTAAAVTAPLSASCSGTAYPESVKVAWNASASGGSGSNSYSWSTYNDVSAYTGGSTQSASFTASYSSSGTKQAVVTVRDSSGSTASATCSANITAVTSSQTQAQSQTQSSSQSATPSVSIWSIGSGSVANPVTVASVASGSNLTRHGAERSSDGGSTWEVIAAWSPQSGATQTASVVFGSAGTYQIRGYVSNEDAPVFYYSSPSTVYISGETSSSRASSNLGSAFVSFEDVLKIFNVLR